MVCEVMDSTTKNMEISEREWQKTSRIYQQNMYNLLGDRFWDHVEDKYLPEKIGYALYSAPSILKDDNMYYTENETKHINKIVSHIKKLKPKHLNMTYIAHVFVVIRMKDDGQEGVVVIFKTQYSDNNKVKFSETFIEPMCRTYKNWNDFLENNKFPKCFMCYPASGMYTAIDGIVDIRYSESPECHNDVLKVLDASSSMVSFSAGAVNIAAFVFPILRPIVWGARAVFAVSESYNITRGVCKLIDNSKHCQGIGFQNPEARRVWIDIIASGFGIVAVGGTAVARNKVERGSPLSSAEVMALRVISVSSLTFGSMKIASELWDVVNKFFIGTLDRQDILKFAATCLFFLNLYLSYTTAKKLIQEFASNSGVIFNLFSTTRNTDFNAVKSIIEFTESHEYYMVRVFLGGIQSYFFPNMNLDDVESIALKFLRLIDKLQSEEISWGKFVLECTEYVMLIWKRYQQFFQDVWNEMCEAFRVKDLRSYYLKTVDCKPFSSVNPDVPHCFNTVTNITLSHIFNDNNIEKRKEEKKLIIQVGQEFIKKFPENNSVDYINKYTFFCEYFVNQYTKFRSMYELSLDEATSRLGLHFNREEFDRSYGIMGESICNFLFNKTLKLFETDKSIFDRMNAEYSNIKQSLPGMPAGFLRSVSSVYYTFCGPKGQKVLTEQQYWLKAKELTGVGFNSTNSKFLYQKDIVLIIPVKVDISIIALLFHGTFEKDMDCVMGLLIVLNNFLRC